MKDMLPAGYWLSSPLLTSMATTILALDKKSLVSLTSFHWIPKCGQVQGQDMCSKIILLSRFLGQWKSCCLMGIGFLPLSLLLWPPSFLYLIRRVLSLWPFSIGFQIIVCKCGHFQELGYLMGKNVLSIKDALPAIYQLSSPSLLQRPSRLLYVIRRVLSLWPVTIKFQNMWNKIP